MDTSYLDNLNRQQTEYLLPCHEIAELTGKEHRNVCADIRNMLAHCQNIEHVKKSDLANSPKSGLLEIPNRGLNVLQSPRL